MLKVCNSLILGSVFAIFANVAMATECDSERVYVSIGAGLSKAKAIKNSSLPIFSTIGGKMTEPNELGLKYKRGINYRAAVGYQFNNIRSELEVSHIRSKYKMLTAGYGQYLSADIYGNNIFPGSTRLISGLANIFYDFNGLNSYFTPYVGAGVGVAWAKNHIELEQAIVPSRLKGNMSDKKLAYQGITGVMLNITEDIATTVDYRYFATTKVKALGQKFQNHSANLGLMCRF